MKRHSIDKFGRTHTFRIDNEALHIDMGNKRLRFVGDPVESHESVNRRYLERLHIPLEQRVRLLESQIKNYAGGGGGGGSSECMSLSADKKSWDAKGLRISNVAAAEQMEDASRLSQTCTFDEKVKKFKVGTRHFDLVETTSKEPVIVASRFTSFAPLEFTAYKNPSKAIIPTYATRWKADEMKLFDAKNLEIVWNDATKAFAYRRDIKNW